LTGRDVEGHAAQNMHRASLARQCQMYIVELDNRFVQALLPCSVRVMNFVIAQGLVS
jgi:hypothetical protein